MKSAAVFAALLSSAAAFTSQVCDTLRELDKDLERNARIEEDGFCWKEP